MISRIVVGKRSFARWDIGENHLKFREYSFDLFSSSFSSPPRAKRATHALYAAPSPPRRPSRARPIPHTLYATHSSLSSPSPVARPVSPQALPAPCLLIGNEGSFRSRYLLSHALIDGMVYIDGKMLPPLVAARWELGFGRSELGWGAGVRAHRGSAGGKRMERTGQCGAYSQEWELKIKLRKRETFGEASAAS